MPDKFYIDSKGNIRLVPEGKEQKFLSKYPGSREATRKELSDFEDRRVQNGISTPRGSDIQDGQGRSAAITPANQPLNGFNSGFGANQPQKMKTRFKDGTEGYVDIPVNTNISQLKEPDLSGISAFKGKPLKETISNTMQNMPVSPEAYFDMSVDRYRQEKDWVEQVKNDSSLSENVKQSLINDYLANTRTPDLTVADKDLPPAAKDWLERNKVSRELTHYNPSVTGGGSYPTTVKENTPEQTAFIKDYIANSEEGKRYAQAHKEFIGQLEGDADILLNRIESIREASEKNKEAYAGRHNISAWSLKGTNYRNDAILGKAANLLKNTKLLLSASKEGDGFRKGLHLTNEDLKELAVLTESFYNDKALNQVIDKYQKAPGSLSEEEAIIIQAKYIADQINAGVDPGSWYNIGQTTKQSLPFMRDFILTAPIGGAAASAVKGGASALAAKTGANLLLSRGIGGTASSLAKGAIDLSVRPAVQTMFSPSSYAMAYQEMQGQAVNKDGQGNIMFGNRKSQGQGMTSAFIENQSEVLGEVVLDKLFQKFRIPVPAFLKTNAAKRLSSATGIQGPITEYAEEKYADLANIVRGEQTIEGFFDPRQNLETFGAVAIMQIPFSAINATGYGIGRIRDVQAKRAIRQTYDRSADSLNKYFGEDAPQAALAFNKLVDNSSEAELKQELLSVIGDERLDDNGKRAIVEYVTAYSAYSGINKAKQEDIQQAEQQMAWLADENINPQMNAVVSAVIAGNGNPVQVTGGNIVQREDGSIDSEASDKQIFYVDAEGNKQVTSIDFIESIGENIPAQDAIAQLIEIETANIISRQENEEVREYLPGETVTADVAGNGITFTGEVTGITQSGNYIIVSPVTGEQVEAEPRRIINQDNIQGVENGSLVEYRNDKGERVQGTVNDAYGLRPQGMMDIDGNGVPVADIIGLVSQSTVNSKQLTQESDNLQATTPESADNLQATGQQNKDIPAGEQDNLTPTGQIPKDEKGNLLFEQAPVEATIGALSEVYNDTAELSGVVDATIGNIRKQIDKAKAPKPTGDINKDIAGKRAANQQLEELNNRLSYWEEVRKAIQESKPLRQQITGQLTGEETPVSNERINNTSTEDSGQEDSPEVNTENENIQPDKADTKQEISPAESETNITPAGEPEPLKAENQIILHSISSRKKGDIITDIYSGVQYEIMEPEKKGLSTLREIKSGGIQKTNPNDRRYYTQATDAEIRLKRDQPVYLWDIPAWVQFVKRHPFSEISFRDFRNALGREYTDREQTAIEWSFDRTPLLATPEDSDRELIQYYNDKRAELGDSIFTPDSSSVQDETAGDEAEKFSLAFGANNKLVSTERYEELKKRMRDKLNNLNAGIDPELFAIGAEMAVYNIEAGARKFADFAGRMIDDLGDNIRPYLKAFYEGARQMPGMETIREEMDSFQIVNSFDVDNLTIFEEESNTPNTNVNETNSDNRSDNRIAENGRIPAGHADADVPGGTTGTQTDGRAQSEQRPAVETENVEQRGRSGRSSGNNADSSGTKLYTGGTSRDVYIGRDDTGDTRYAGQTLNTNNNRQSREENVVPRGNTAKINANIAAIKLAKRLIETGKKATPEQMNVLRRYTGWGGLSSVFQQNDKNYKALQDLLTVEEYDSARASTTTAFYTPPEVTASVWDMIEKLGFKGGNILEPSAGIGNFFALMPESISNVSRLRGVELDTVSGSILKLLYPDANINISGFEKQRIANNSMDLVISNVPFGNFKVYDSNNKDISTGFDIHDYFIAKSVRTLKAGGIGVFITTSSTLDKSSALRNWVINNGNADFIDAVRLNTDTFKNDAGTEATADIIIVRKRDVNGISPYARNMQDSVMEREATYTIQEKNQWGYNTGEVEKKARMVYNKYFLDNPTRMAGEMKFGFEGGNAIRPTEQRLAPVKAINQQEVINRMIDELPGNIYNTTPASDTSKAVANNGTKEGGLTIIDGQAYIIQYNEAIPVDWNSNKAAGYPKTEILKDYLDIKESIDLLLEAEHNNDANIDTYRKNLNKVYDNFVKKYGALNENKKINFLQDDIDFPSVSAIENIEDGKDGEKTITKSDIFSKRVIDNQIEPKADNVEDAVRVSINQNGKVDIPYIARLLHKTNEEVQSEIVSKRIGFVNPETGLIEARNQYLSGNVRDKLSIAQQANQDNEYDSNIEELSKVIPADIPINLIKLTLGSTWVPTNVYEDFFKETFDVNAKLTKTSTDKYIGKISGKNNARDIQMGMPEASGSTLALNAMNNATTTISMQVWEDGKRKTVTDPLKTTQAAAKQTEIAETFEAWVKQKKEYHEELENIYNNTFNAVVNSAVDVDSFDRFPGVGGKVVSLGSKELENGKELHQYRVAKENTEADNELVVREAKSLGLKLDPETGIYSTHLRGDADVFFKKLNGTAKILRQHQKEGVIRGLESATLLAHEVGTGKTLTLITIAMEMRRLGLAKKPAIIVQRSTYKQFVKEIKNQYPNAKVLAPSEKDLTAKQRQQLFAKIAYNDWDIVVLYHSYLDSIPDNPQRVAQYIDEKISEKMDLLAEMERAKEDGAANAGRMMGALKKEIERLERDRDNTLNPDIEEESDTPTKSKRKRSVKDIEKVRSNAEAKAEKSLDRRTDNTMTFEQLGIDALLIDEAHAYKKLGFVTSLQRVKGIDTAESKRAQSTRLKSSYILENRNGKNVVLATGTPISNTMAEMWTFMRYLYPRTEMGRLQMNNFDAFVNNFGSIEESAEFGSNGKFRITNRFSSYSNVPELIAAWRQVTHTVLTEEVSTLKEGVGTPRVEGGKPADIMLEQTPPLKSVMKAIRNKLEEFDRMSGAEKKENSYIPLVMFGLAKRAAIDVRLVDPDLPDHPDSKLNRTVAEVVQDLKDTQSYKGTVAIFCDSYQSSDKAFNVFREIKQKLVDNGIPAGQVAIINDFDKDDAREKLFIAVNKGDVRVVLGTTEKLGVGVNIQERLHMAVHMDAPLRPSDYQQRNGRIMRQGNTHLNMDKTIKILRVGVQKTLDVTGYQRLEIKKKFIDQIMKGDVSQRMLEEADIESTDSSNFNQMMANLSGSQAALALSIEQNKLKKLQNARQYHEDNQVYMAGAVRRAKSIIVGNGQAIERFEEYRKELQRLVPDGKITTISIGKVSANTPEDIDIVLNQHITKRIDKEAAGLREDFLRNDAIIRNSIAINGIKVDLVVNITRNYDTDTKKTRITKEIFYTTPDVKLHNPLMSDPKNILPVFEGRAGANIQNVIDDINDLLSGYDIDKGIQKYKLGIDKAQRDIDAYEPQIGQPFAKEKELRATEEKVKDLNAQMEAELKQIEEAEAKEDVEAIDIDGIVEKNIEDTPESDTRIQASSGNFESIPAEKFNSLIDTLNQTGLAVEVVLDENIRSNPEIKDTQGNVYGYVTPDGVIYLDATRINANTPVHEFGHLWNSFIKENNPELWKKGVELIRQSPYYRECIYNNPAYSGLPEERKIDEALAMAIGDKGEKTVNSEQLTVNKLKVWLKDVWNVIKKAFGFNTDMAVEDMSLSDFTDRAVKDLFGGERLTNPGKNNNFGESKNNNNTRYGRRAETGLDNPGTMGRSAISGLVAEPEKRSGISKVIAAVNTAGSVSTIYDAEELEELEARGIDPYFDKTVFRKVLKDRARQNNVWFDKDYLNDKILLHDQKQTGTSENDVYLNPDGNTLTKLNNLSYVKGTGHKNNMAALVDRLSAHNALFPNIVYTIKGFMDNKNGFPSLVTEQPYIKNIERNATQEEIDGFLTEHGFKKDGVRDWSNGHEVWSNGKYELFDVRPANVLMGKDGNLYFIDTVPHSVGYMNDSKNTEAISKQELSEMEQIKQLSVNNSTFMKAPNGEPTNLNERQWLQVRTANFKNWFGDWENDPGNASKVIDENGEPLVVYHGTKNGGWTTPYIKGQPVFFTSNKETAKGYAKKYHTPVKEDIPVKNYPHKKYAVNYGVFLNIREHDNPAEFNAGKKSYNSYAIPLYNPMTGSEGLGGLDDMARNVVYEQRPYIIRNIYDNKDYNENDLSDIYIVPFANGGMIKSATDNTGSFDPADNDIRFQSVSDIAIATNSAMTAAARRQLDGRLKNFRFRIREAWEDRHLAVKEFLDVLRRHGTDIAGYNDYYKQATHINGKIDAGLENYNEKFQKPLNKAVGELEKAGFDYRAIENYAILKHGLERNKWMKEDAVRRYAERYPDATPQQLGRFEINLPDDFSGITAVEAEVGTHAEGFIAEFEHKAGEELIYHFWKSVKNATLFSIGKQLEGGLIDKKTYDELAGRYDYYIPLRGHDDETAEDRWDYSPNMGTYFVAPLIRAKGRRTRSESPLAFIFSMAQSAVSSANRNILNQTILRLALKDKTGLLGVNKAWYMQTGLNEDGVPVYEIQAPAYSENTDQYRINIEEFEERMQKLQEQGLAVQNRGKLDIGGLFIKKTQASQHVVYVSQNGAEYAVYINGNPAVARAINGINAKDLHKDLRFIAKVSRQMAANFTTRNPIFVATNFSRDYIFASSILGVKEDAKYALQFQSNIPRSAGALQRYIRNKADLSEKADRYVIEYIMNGGKTGFSHLVELDAVRRKIEREIKKGDSKSVLHTFLDALEGCNEFAENLSRLSVYITSREQGRPVVQSISDAKEVTVNFNRNGAGGYGAAWFRSLYLFVNAGIQALSNFAKVAQKNKGKTAILVSSYAMSGFLMPLLTALTGGDDGLDDYMKLSDWERQNNLCIYTGSGFVKIPLPHELRVFHAMGDNIYQAVFGRKDIAETLPDVILSFSDLIPANPAGSIRGSWADMMPDAVKPFFQLKANRNYTGGRITNEWADENKPGYLRIRTNKKGEPYAPAFLVKLGESLDKATGGDGVEKGIVSFNPDEVNHLIHGYFGGLYATGMQVLDMSYKAYDWTDTGELKLKVRETPLKTFYTSGSDLMTAGSGLNPKYFKIADDMQETRRKVKGYKEQAQKGDLTTEEFAAKINSFSPDIERYKRIYPYIKQIRKYESALKELDGEEQKEAEKIIANLKKEVVQMY